PNMSPRKMSRHRKRLSQKNHKQPTRRRITSLPVHHRHHPRARRVIRRRLLIHLLAMAPRLRQEMAVAMEIMARPLVVATELVETPGNRATPTVETLVVTPEPTLVRILLETS